MRLVPDGDARVLRIDGERVELDASRAAAPGSRIEGQVDGRTLRVKVHRCVRDGERFKIEGRFIDLRRVDREHLLAQLS